MCHAFEKGTDVIQTTLFGLWSDWSQLLGETPRSRSSVADVIQTLVGNGILKETGASYAIDVTCLPTPLCALFFDVRVRNIVSGVNIRDFIVSLLAIKDRAYSERARREDDIYDDE
jgi:hypothetical protein